MEVIVIILYVYSALLTVWLILLNKVVVDMLDHMYESDKNIINYMKTDVKAEKNINEMLDLLAKRIDIVYETVNKKEK